jgi:hypothetical protein
MSAAVSAKAPDPLRQDTQGCKQTEGERFQAATAAFAQGDSFGLWNEEDGAEVTEDTYLPDQIGKYHDHLLEMYKRTVETVEKVRDRQLELNKLFYALNAALVGAIGFLLCRQEGSQEANYRLAMCLSWLGMPSSLLWWGSLWSHAEWASGIGNALIQMEGRLPAAPIRFVKWRANRIGLGYYLARIFEKHFPLVVLAVYLFVALGIGNWGSLFLFKTAVRFQGVFQFVFVSAISVCIMLLTIVSIYGLISRILILRVDTNHKETGMDVEVVTN